jgi:iduronate 2-sulfatase
MERLGFTSLLFAIALSAPAAAAERPNVLFIAVDDLNVNLGCYGDTDVLSTNIDRLASRSVIFNRAYCQQAVCNPSRASVMTGRRPDTIKVWDLRTDFRAALPNVVTLPQHFKNNGYHARAIGKIYHNMGGLDDETSWSMPAVLHAGRHTDTYVLPRNKNVPRGRKADTYEDGDVPDDAYRDGKIADLAGKALRELRDKPFFLAVGFWRPHVPFFAPKKYWDLYDRDKLRPPKPAKPPTDVPAVALHNSREMRGYRDIPNEGPISAEKTMQLRHGYYASISYLDAQVGKVLDELDRLKLTDKTIVVFWSDHGYHLGEHGLWCKTTNFELDTRVPLIIAVPGIDKKGSSKTDQVVELIDLYPTLTELCGLPKPNSTEGISLYPIVKNPMAVLNKRAAYSQHPRPAYANVPMTMGYSARTRRYRYTEWRNIKTGALEAREYYDEEIDGLESINLAKDVKQERLSEMSKLLQKGFPRGHFGK